MRRLEAKLDRIAAAVALPGGDSGGRGPGTAAAGPTPTQQPAPSGEDQPRLAADRGSDGSRHCHEARTAAATASTAAATATSSAAARRESAARDSASDAADGGSGPRLAGSGSRHADPLRANGPDSEGQGAALDAGVAREAESRAVKLQLEGLDRTLALVAGAVGVNHVDGERGGGDDRRRLKEKLKEAMESGQRLSVRQIDSEREMWAEYIFGICKPDGRVGKVGSR